MPVATSTRAPNRLIYEKSPYLLQHAYNPVDWWPWCDEAFEEAKRRDMPVFLSIGYSTCHWCHVMAHESFEDEEVARLLNAQFIAIKMDREERPDIDAVYMRICQAMTGGGGWPLTVFMTPEKNAFFSGTYFPKHQKYGQIGLIELLLQITGQWDDNKDQLKKAGIEITAATEKFNSAYQTTAQTATRVPIKNTMRELSQSFDKRYGGFGRAPKFPVPHNLLFLMSYAVMEQDNEALNMVEQTLQGMYKGGIYDHIGFGFSRYSTDEKWLVPHFEKMLYDNALIILALLHCYGITQNSLYRDIAEKTILYVSRELTSPEGGFYCAQDADSEGEEGKYYTFTHKEILRELGEAGGALFCRTYDITDKGNFEGKNIPNLLQNEAPFSINQEIPPLCDALYAYRKRRFRIHRDEKILTSWNALMIAAYAKVYQLTYKEIDLSAAENALDFINNQLTGKTGLHISYCNGKVSGEGLLDDYAFLTWACLSLYEATYEVSYLSQAAALCKETLKRFADQSEGGFFLSQESAADLIFRPKEQYDGALPSGNSIIALCLVKLFVLTGEGCFGEAAEKQMSYLLPAVSSQPKAHTFAALSLMQSVYPGKELLCVLRENKNLSEVMEGLRLLPPYSINILVKTPENAAKLAEIAPYTKEYPIPENQGSVFYLCDNKSCSSPIYSLKEVLDRLAAARK